MEQSTAIELKSSLHHKRSKTLKKYTGLLYIAPWLLGFLGFQLYPLVSSFYYSFTNLSLGGNPKFVGLDNYIRIFTVDPEFLEIIKCNNCICIYISSCKISVCITDCNDIKLKIKIYKCF